MNTKSWHMRFFITVVKITLLVLALQAKAQAGASVRIYGIYGHNQLVEIDLLKGQLTTISAAGADATYVFSNRRDKVAYWDHHGLWISSLETWNPSLVYEEANTIVTGLRWLPDDTRIIVRDSDNGERIYDLTNRSIQDWLWTSCDRVALDRALRVALVCSPKDARQNSIAVYWDEGLARFILDSATVFELGDLSEPAAFDWSFDGSVVAVVRRSEDDKRAGFDTSYILRDGNANWTPSRISFLFETQKLKLSPDNHRLAFSVRRGAYYLLDIYDLNVNKSIWQHPLDLVDMRFADDMQWYSDGSKVVILGFNEPSSDVYIVDVRTQQLQQYTVNNKITSIAILEK